MNRFLVTSAVTFVFLSMIPLIAIGQGRDIASGAGEGFVVMPNSGHIDLVEFSLSANSEADGSNARGHIHFRYPDGTNRDYEVYCLIVTGNTATIGGATTSGGVVLITVTDSGAPRGVGDAFAGADLQGQGAVPCQPLSAQLAMSGNIRVHDAP